MTAERGITTLQSPLPFAQTVQRIVSALAARGLKIFATWDQQAEAKAVGLDMPPTTLIVFGNPKAGTALMLAQPQSALDLPLKVLVSQDAAGTVVVSFNTAEFIIQRHGLPAQMVANLQPAFTLIEQTLRV